ncbi:hypothetical protein B0H11DRAFT_2210463 [Mycena galericulata]|nr:hypothetical protein B0H11DRAFT_2210463 [Mycena galericulata]
MALQCYNSYKVSYFGAIKFLTGSIKFRLQTAARELQIRSIAKTCRRSSKHDKVKIQSTFLPFEDGLYILAQGIVLSAFGWITLPSPLSIMRPLTPPALVHQLRPCCGDTPRCTAASWETSYSWPVKLLALASLNPQRAPAGAYKQGVAVQPLAYTVLGPADSHLWLEDSRPLYQGLSELSVCVYDTSTFPWVIVG